MSAMMMGASAVNRGYQYSERRGLEEQGRREESLVRLMERCGVGFRVDLAGLRMCWSKHRYGHGRDLTLIVSCVSVSSGGGALVDWVSSSFFLRLRIRSIRMTLPAGAFARTRPLIWPTPFAYFIVHAFVAPPDAIQAVWPS